MFSKNDRKMIESINSKYDLCNYSLKMRCDDLWDRVNKAERENFSLRAKVDLYEKFIEILTEWTIHEKEGMPKTMSADFQCMTGFTKKFKEE